jgi:hypothetical protein
MSAGQKIPNERANPDANGDGLIGVLMHGFINGLGAFDRLFPNAAIDLFAPFQGDRQAAAGFLDFFSCRLGGGVNERLRVLGQLIDFVTHGLCLLIRVLNRLSFSGLNNIYRLAVQKPFRPKVCWAAVNPRRD